MHRAPSPSLLSAVVALLIGVAVPRVAHAAAPSEPLAAAIRAWYDAPATASSAFAALHADWPEDEDVAWWLARVRLGEGQVDEARALLEGRVGRSIPSWRFHWLLAEAWVAPGAAPDVARARAEADRALEGGASRVERLPMLPLAAELAWRDGAEGVAVARVREAGGSAGVLEAWRRVGTTAAIRIEVAGRARWVLAGGLVVPEPTAAGGGALAEAAPVEGPGPDLFDVGGATCLRPGTRADLVPVSDGWAYAALEGPDTPGIYTLERCGAAPQLLHAGPSLASPARFGDTWLWIDAGRVHTAEGVVWPDVRALRVAAGPSGILVVVWDDGVTRLRWTPALDTPLAPLFFEDPPITRATWLPQPPAGSPPGSPPPPPAHPR